MSFPPYPSYQDSGVEWLGAVPRHWRVERLGNLYREVSEAGSPELPVLSVSIHSGVSDEEAAPEDNERKIVRSEDRSKYKRVSPNDLTYNMMRAWQGGFGTVQVEGMVSPAYVVARPRTEVPSKYIELLLRTPGAVEEMRRHSRGVTDFRLRLYWDQFKDIRVALPPQEERNAILAFVDRETSKIDALVDEQRRLIGLLQKKRQAAISHAVTKGLDPTAPMKDSGVEWLGEVPAHWVVTALKRYSMKVTDGAHISPETEGGIHCFVSTRDVSDQGIDFEGCLRTTPQSFDYLVKTGCNPEFGDVLFSKDGTVGRTTVVRDAPDFVVASSLIIIRPSPEILNAEFLDLLCKSDAVQQQVASYVKGAGLPRLSIQNLLRVIGVFPPIDEQSQIVAATAPQLDAIRQLHAAADAATALLNERRSAFIRAAVTGKIDVRYVDVQQAEAA
ncbi:restriction endonuclease subunit S [Sphingomonas prati]|uniref:Type I restriction enzyme S subunit n=1 Tax=Sphingomonas prati TaxID=1843237 RepID=A0A7W9BQM0_9SPHN|nr:restriction endonuclease subunit S [Sphingomonas prati]MBB5728307.1 type I restriction enzyme S subunit [Sphingomonas prati]GGE74823.1 restriction modification system DNA specificity domain-containing protein [Sphingomonas prati]